MQRAATLVHPPCSPRLPALRSWWRGVWSQLTLDADERFLHGATDLADLEQRLHRLEQGRNERFWPLDG